MAVPWDDDRVEAPHTAFEPHTALKPVIVLETQTALVPQTALLPQTALAPHTAFVPQTALLPQTVFEPSTRYVVPVTQSNVAIGDAALAEATSVFASAAATSRYPAPIVKISYVETYVIPVLGSVAVLCMGNVFVAVFLCSAFPCAGRTYR